MKLCERLAIRSSFERLFSFNIELLLCNDLMDFVSFDTQYYSETPLCMTHKKLKSPIQLREVDDHGIA